jgi:peroxiredoxin
MIAQGTSVGAALLAERLVGLAIPSVVLDGGWEPPMNLRDFASHTSSVVYFYAGCGSLPADHKETALIDAAQHRAFAKHQQDFEARGHVVVGISSQSKGAQRRTALANRLTHLLLCDPELQLARALGLPTFTRYEECWYQRLVLVVISGHIEKAFFPVANASRGAAQVLAWMLLQGREMDGYDDAG